ncbi:DUF2490 domain-containing protein [Maribacter polysaccharolyticus]|uniref:DUF2490 domain-containing protein n=1 Tax=Maribacter polysaccharolyticus TaxID=3020831 RepID=UPI00237F57D5|nr:DUF2490 domain-containing protein [Maribacter polysaccharolyticus]MDE3742020.1 DUF2490 domain-containing protein [Maribacter polysaccharolyticus]
MELIHSKNLQYVALIVALMIGVSGFSQTEDTDDLQSWTAISLKYKLNKKWSFELEEQLRLDANISEVSEYFTEIDAEYSISKSFDIGGGLRYVRENDNEGNVQGYENHLRFHIDASYKHKINAFSLKYRLRYQNKNELGVDASEGDYAKQNIRFKTSVGYDFKNWKLDPEFSAEIFNHFEEGEDNGFSKYRLTLGTDYKIKKYGKIGLFYRMEKELNVDLPETAHIIGLKYAYTIKNK